jgi:phosphoserine phosphatase
VIGSPVAVWNVDGALCRRDTLLPLLSRIAGPVVVTRSRPGAGPAALLQRVLGGREFAEVDRIARDHAVLVARERLRRDSLDRWLWHRGRGDRLVLASAAPELYLRHLGAVLGATAVLGTALEEINGRLTGRTTTEPCQGVEKARRVLDHLAAEPGGPLWVYAGHRDDRPLLDLADVAVRVRAYRRLRTPADLSSGSGGRSPADPRRAG